MEEILSKLLIADNATIKQSTAELKEALKNPESTSALCQIIISSINPQIRQYAGVLLRKRYKKNKNWTKLPVNIRTEVKALLLQGLVREPEKNVKNSIAQLIGVIVKHELNHNTWPELFQFIQQLVSSSNMSEKELGMYTLSTMTEMAPEIYIAHLDSICTLLNQTFNSLSNEFANPVAYYIVRTMTFLTPFIEKNQMMVNTYNQMLPLSMNTIKALITVNQEKAIEALELFEDLCLNAIVVISAHLKSLIFLMLELARNKELSIDLRVKSVGVISYLVKVKPRAIQKLKLNEPIIDVVFELLSNKPDNETDEDYTFDDSDESTPVTCATEILDLLALHMKPEKVVSRLLNHIETSLKSNDNYAKKAAYLSMAFLSEGCSEYIRSKYLESFLFCICQGITDPSPVVKNSALFALGQFSENLQPEISQYAEQLLPVLFNYLGQMAVQLNNDASKEPAVEKIFYALETFCENLNDGILPYLPTLMEKLFQLLETNNIDIKQFSISAIGAVANASKENLAPYFIKIISYLDIYLNQKQTDETMCLQIQSIDTLGVIARTIGHDNFNPFINKSLELGLKLINENDDPDIRKAVYGLFASLSSIMKDNIEPALPQILNYIFQSIQSSEGIVVHDKDNDEAAFAIFEDLSGDDDNENGEEDIENTDNEDDDDDDDDEYDINNGFIEEKEEAILALKEIAEYTDKAFIPYLEKSFEETFTIVNFQHQGIRKVAIEALTQFCINFSKIETDEGRNASLKALSVFLPKLSELIRLDTSPSVVISGLESLADLLKEVKTYVIVGEGHKEAIMNCIVEVFTNKLQCQDQDHEDGDDDEAEQEEYMIECAGDVLASFGKVMPPEDFAHCFQTVLPYLCERLKDTNSEAKRSFGVGIISECLAGLKHTTSTFSSQLYPLFKKCINDPNFEVRNNAYYGIGELVFWGKEALYPNYNDIILLLAQALPKEEAPGPRDNMVGVIARIIITNYSLINIEQVFPGFVQQLPLRQDFEEYESVFKSILTLYKDGHQVIKPHMRHLLKLAIDVLHTKSVPNEATKFLITDFINSAQQDFPEDWNAVFNDLPEELQRILSE